VGCPRLTRVFSADSHYCLRRPSDVPWPDGFRFRACVLVCESYRAYFVPVVLASVCTSDSQVHRATYMSRCRVAQPTFWLNSSTRHVSSEVIEDLLLHARIESDSGNKSAKHHSLTDDPKVCL